MELARFAPCFLLITLISTAPSMAAESNTDFDFVRAMYGPWDLDEMAEIRFDAKYQNTWWLHQGSDRVLDRFARDSVKAAENGVLYIAGLYYHAAPWDRLEFDYTHAVHLSGVVEPYTPSPVDMTWWNKTMHEPAVAVANLSLHYPIWGLVWDIELYGHSAMMRYDYSYDLLGIGRFAEEHNIALPELEKNGGYDWLRSGGLLGDYHSWLADTVYGMAKETEQAVHAINPNFSLGLLGFIDSWHHWAILKAFNCSTASVTAWTEFTYGGYKVVHTGKTGGEGVGFFQDEFRELGLNGKVLPGLRPSHRLGKFLYDLGFASRHNGAFWIYQHNGDPFARVDPETYIRMYRILDEYIFFNTSDVFYLPGFDLKPGAITHPYLGPDGQVSVLIYTFDEEVPFGFEIVTDSPEVYYVGENLTEVSLPGPNPTIPASDLPCIITGLSEEDLVRTEARALIRELEYLLNTYESLGFAKPPGTKGTLSQALTDYDDGRYGDARSLILATRNETYGYGLEAVSPLVEEGFADPRNSRIPLDILRKFDMAQGQFTRGDFRKGELNLIEGLKMLESVPEPLLAAILVLLALSIYGGYRPREPCPSSRIYL